MKKLLILLTCLISTKNAPFILFNKENNSPAIQINFISTPTDHKPTDLESEQKIKSLLNILKKYAAIQEQRKLNFEEMSMIMQILIFLFLQETNDYSKKIEVTLKDDQKIVLPYSIELLASLFQQNNSDDSTNE